MPVNKHCGRLEGEGHTNGHRDVNLLRSGRQNDLDRANLVVLQHLDVLEDFVTLHKETIAKKYRDHGVHRLKLLESITPLSCVGSKSEFWLIPQKRVV